MQSVMAVCSGLFNAGELFIRRQDWFVAHAINSHFEWQTFELLRCAQSRKNFSLN
jgi:hypothetical protein